ncbi:Dimeric dUTPase [hydrothermal vent metagenome]|uniref:Dimeric dUTPase n=1 Tax=hydrothermal vent metagenome TaxID=652676 RepID=A0A1W1EKK1_9ZZZZ
MNLIYQMLTLQQELNDSTNGKNWEEGITKNGKEIDWRRCIFMESAELIDSYPWKHWKSIDAKADIDNARIEVVDIWHFVMSLALEDYKINLRGDIGFLAKRVEKLENYPLFVDNQTINPNYKDTILNIEDMIKAIFTHKSLDEIIDKFMVVAIDVGLNLDSIYKLYVGKNILNVFRQNNGYKDGTYVKIWNGREDNEVMSEILNSNDIKPKELYDKLIIEYNKL